MRYLLILGFFALAAGAFAASDTAQVTLEIPQYCSVDILTDPIVCTVTKPPSWNGQECEDGEYSGSSLVEICCNYDHALTATVERGTLPDNPQATLDPSGGGPGCYQAMLTVSGILKWTDAAGSYSGSVTVTCAP